jgi:hypothetical protein
VTRVSVPGPDPVRRASFGTRLTFRSLEPTRGSRAPVSLQLRRSQRLVRRLRGLRAVGEPDGRRARPRVCVAVARPAADRACGAPSAPRRRLSLHHRQQGRGAGRRRAVARPVCCSPGNAGLARRRAPGPPAGARPPSRVHVCRRHDVNAFVRTCGVATHEHCEATMGNPACGHYLANPPCRGALDGFDRLYGVWLSGTKPDCSQLRCLG